MPVRCFAGNRAAAKQPDRFPSPGEAAASSQSEEEREQGEKQRTVIPHMRYNRIYIIVSNKVLITMYFNKNQQKRRKKQ